jgi:uncharacterized protein
MIPWRAGARLAFALALVSMSSLALGAASSAAQDSTGLAEPEIPAPVGFVNDRAGVLQESTRARLEAFLDQVKRKTGAEFAVLTVPSTEPLTPSEYKVKAFERWGLGKHGEDNGLLLLLAVKEREAWFETGYGLEGVLPDGLEARIVREEMSPRFRAGDLDGCVIAGVQAAAVRIAADKGVTLEWDGRELRYRPASRSGRLPWWLPLLIFFLVWMVASRMSGYAPRRRRLWGPYWGGPWGGMGGWGGGGGGSWGGSFGGGSFGGFGGGASGGGGGGGHL